MRLVLDSLPLNSVTDYGESRFKTVNDSGELLLYLLSVRYEGGGGDQYEAGTGQSSTCKCQ
jgi:hypothetical protein